MLFVREVVSVLEPQSQAVVNGVNGAAIAPATNDARI